MRVDFDLEWTLKLNNFNYWYKNENGSYTIFYKNAKFIVSQHEAGELTYSGCTEEVIIDLFDLKTKYNKIYNSLAESFIFEDNEIPIPTIRILNQDIWSCYFTLFREKLFRSYDCVTLKEYLEQYEINLVDSRIIPTINKCEEYLACLHSLKSKTYLSLAMEDSLGKIVKGYVVVNSLSRKMKTRDILGKLLTIEGVEEELANNIAIHAFHKLNTCYISNTVRKVLIEKYNLKESTSFWEITIYMKMFYEEYEALAKILLEYYYRYVNGIC